MVVSETFENLPQMQFMLFDVVRCNANVVDVDKYKIEAAEYIVHKSLKCLGRSAQTKRHLVEFKQSEWCYDCRFGDVAWLDGDLMVCTIEVDFAKHVFSMQKMREILNVR